MPSNPIAYYRPRWKGEVEGYLVNFVSRNIWKVARTLEPEDVMQEGYLVFAKVRDRYCGPGSDRPISQGAHFMALFKTSWQRRFTDLANKDTSDRVNQYYGHDDSERRSSDANLPGELENDGYLATLLRQAPDEVRIVLTMFLDTPQELLALALSHWRPGHRADPTINRLLGRAEDDELMGRVSDYLQ